MKDSDRSIHSIVRRNDPIARTERRIKAISEGLDIDAYVEEERRATKANRWIKIRMAADKRKHRKRMRQD